MIFKKLLKLQRVKWFQLDQLRIYLLNEKYILYISHIIICVMEQYIILTIFMILLITIGIMEHLDRKKLPDVPDCTYITNYCTAYGEKQNLKYVIKEPNNNENAEALLSKIENDCCRVTNTVYWRMSLFAALIICIFTWIFNYLDEVAFKYTTYFFLLIITWFLNYWMRNYLDFHYHNHMCKRVQESIKQLKSKILNN